jgi:hypothetical protein
MKEIKEILDNIVLSSSVEDGDTRIAMQAISELVTINRLLVEKIEQISGENK